MALKAIHKYFLYWINYCNNWELLFYYEKLKWGATFKMYSFWSKEDKNTYSYQFVTDIPLVKPLDGMENQ